MLKYLMCYQHRLSSKLILVEHDNKLEKNSSTPTYEATVLGEKGARSSRNGKEKAVNDRMKKTVNLKVTYRIRLLSSFSYFRALQNTSNA